MREVSAFHGYLMLVVEILYYFASAYRQQRSLPPKLSESEMLEMPTDDLIVHVKALRKVAFERDN